MERERNSRGAKRPRKKVCMFCADRVEEIDYKDIARLRELRFCQDVLPVHALIISVS